MLNVETTYAYSIGQMIYATVTATNIKGNSLSSLPSNGIVA